MSVEATVQQQLDAYNRRDVEALLAIYADDAQMFEHPAKLIARGSADFRERFAARSREPNLHAQLLNRVVMGNIVIDHERVTRTFAHCPGSGALVMIYQVQDDRIGKAWMLAGATTLDGE
ncbi:MAG TPA: nuclear transport factor 2 family protein [Xanthobacteraceae bacterium]|jgi:hypothetical protein|nr:nuclear transport factor 2 family protein [Xanthobacteraceae bacterium]